MKKTICLLTAEYPYGKSESFIENEIEVLQTKFEKVLIMPHTSQRSEKRALPTNAEQHDLINHRADMNTRKLLVSNLFFIVWVLLIELWHCPRSWYFLKNIRYFNSLLIRAIYDSEKIKELIKQTGEGIIFHSYWMNDWALALAVLKRKGEIPKFVFRCGGFDIFDERHKGNFVPFRHFVYSQTAAVYPNSQYGEHYIKTKNCFPEKVKLQYLGTKNYGINQFDNNAVFTIVSCSNVIPLKRVDMIIEILKHIKFEVKWVHFGDGKSMQDIIEKSLHLPANICCELKGRVTNKAIIEYYQTHPVHLFIMTSETESLPVSIQEAISFGIPVMATSVGGVGEIVTEQTGMLIDANIDAAYAAEMITEFKLSDKNTSAFRKGVRLFWEKHFDVEKSIAHFYDDLIRK